MGKTITYMTAVLILVSVASCITVTAPISEKRAIKIAKAQLSSSRHDLIVRGVRPGNNFVAAGPHSGGGPKWVIGFFTRSKDKHEDSIHYVTVFPDGRTSSSEIREGAHMGSVAQPKTN